MFSKEELDFIETILTDEQFRIVVKRQNIGKFEDLKNFNEFIENREIFIINLLKKINNINQ